jgi:MFS family permease
VGAFLADKRMWIMVGAYFFWNLGNLGILFWLPTILKSSAYALSGSNQVVGSLYGFFFFCAFIGMYAISWFSHRVGDRSAALLICSVVPFATLTVSAFTASPILAYVMMCIAAFCIWGLLPIFWTLPAEYMHGRTAAGGIAFISSFSGVGGLFGPWMIGVIRDATGKFPLAIFAMALAFLVQGGFILAMKIKKTGSRVSLLA